MNSDFPTQPKQHALCHNFGIFTRWLALSHLIVFAGFLAVVTATNAGTGCSEQPYDIDPSKYTLGPQHHPMGKPLPTIASFNQTDQCIGTIHFFDQNNNGKADPEEVRVFGSLRQLDCGSCHIESADASATQSAGTFLRQSAATLCLVCHRI